MGVCESKKEEAYTGHKAVPMNIANKTLKSICKIIVNSIEGDIYGTGFFMKINDSKKYLITNYHVISEERINDEIVIEIHNHKTMKLKKGNRVIKYFKRPKDITVIEIKNNDDIYKDIDFLDYDYNCVPNRYKFYENIDVFSIQHPLGDNAACGSGTIININNYEFEHTISTDNGSSGCPIILLNSNINFIQVIGIHKNANVTKKLNYGTFIGEIFNTNYSNKNINSVVSFAEPKEVPIIIDSDIEFETNSESLSGSGRFSRKKNGGLNAGAIVAIILALAAAIISVIAIMVYCKKENHNKNETNESTIIKINGPKVDSTKVLN